MSGYIKGMDISTLKELEQLGAKYYDKGMEKSLWEIMKEYGVNMVRLRLWHNPYDEDGRPYGGGTNDLVTTIELAKAARSHGIKWLLDIHYSDYWADPRKQFKPKAWKNYSVEQLEEAVYSYTKDVLNSLSQEGVFPDMIQIGNEVSQGMLWPEGRVPNYENLTRFINAGIRATKEMSTKIQKKIQIMLHLDGGSDNMQFRTWFDKFIEQGEDFDIIGLSYYPLWNGDVKGLICNLNDLAVRYGKELVIAEVAMPFTLEDYADREGLPLDNRKGMCSTEEFIANIPYPITLEGQKQFMKEFIEETAGVTGGKCRGFFYWEPAWLPIKDSGWANQASLSYMQSEEPEGNEWANQCLFDYDGNALPVWEVIRETLCE